MGAVMDGCRQQVLIVGLDGDPAPCRFRSGIVNIRQTGTPVKGAGTDFFHAHRDRHALQAGASGKGTIANGGHALGDHHAVQGSAAIEGIFSDGSQASRQMDRGQASASAERLIANALQAFRQDNGGQSRQVAHCIDGSNALFDDDGGDPVKISIPGTCHIHDPRVSGQVAFAGNGQRSGAVHRPGQSAPELTAVQDLRSIRLQRQQTRQTDCKQDDDGFVFHIYFLLFLLVRLLYIKTPTSQRKRYRNGHSVPAKRIPSSFPGITRKLKPQDLLKQMGAMNHIRNASGLMNTTGPPSSSVGLPYIIHT